MSAFKTSLIPFIFLLLIACGSYDPNSKIEVAAYPDLNAGENDNRIHIDHSLKIMYPNIGKYTLENELDGHKVDFFLGGSSFRVSFDSLGNWKKSKVIIRFTKSINESVKGAIRNSEFKRWQVVKKELSEKPGEIEYEFEFKKGDQVYQVKYDGQGKLLKKERSTIQLVK